MSVKNNQKNESINKSFGHSGKKCNKDFNENISSIEDELLSLKNTLSPNEFFNAVKSGFDLALCINYFFYIFIFFYFNFYIYNLILFLFF